ncbi:MAG TPA: ATP-binding protein [Polyangiaceae bacterium]|jgi:PAS domain S-box-containing protein
MTGDPASDSRRLHGLSDTMRAFAEATTDYVRLLNTVAERMAKLVGDGCVLVLISESEQTMRTAAVYFEDPQKMAIAERLLAVGSVSLEDSPLGMRLTRSRDGLLIPEVDRAALERVFSPQNAKLVGALGLHSLLALPLEIRGRLLGLVGLLRVGEAWEPFDAEDEAVARNLAEHAALALSNAQLLAERERELSEFTRAEQRARQFEALIEHSDDFVAMATLEGAVLFVNQAGRRLLGIAPDADVSLLPLSRFHTEEGMARAPIIREKGRYQGPGQLRHMLTDELINTQVNSFIVRNEQGEPFAFATVQHDTREMQRLEAHVRQMQRLEALGRLAGGVAHDFNNVLSVILGYSTILLRELVPGTQVAEDVREIHTAGERAARLTHQLLAFGRRQVLELKIVDLNEIVSGMEKMTERLLGEDITLDIRRAAALGKVKVDVGQIEQVILNLALNGRDAMRQGGVLTIATSNAEERMRPGDPPSPAVMLSVADTGSGMDEATQQRAFEPFFTTKAVGKGTGLGLATVFGVVEQSGGRIALSSAPGRGSTFVIHLPRCDEEPPPRRASVRPPQPSVHETETILLVEDEAQVRKLIVAILSGAGYRVLAAGDPVEALRMSEHESAKIDLLLTDVIMPTMNGRELAKLLERTRPDTKVLYLSGYTDDAIAHHGVLDAGIVLLQKPVTPDALLQQVREVLDSADN